MEKFVIVTDSSCDLIPELQAEYGIKAVQLYVTTEDGRSVRDCDFDKKALYNMLREKKVIRTSAASVGDFCDAFESIVRDGYDIIYMGFSSGLSSVYHAGETAAEDIREKYPDRKIYTVDTLCASLGQGMLVKLASEKQRSGATIEEVRDYIIDTRLKLCHWFTLDDLFYLKRGGRISATEAVVGSMLGIKPVMHMDNAGHLVSVTKARGRKASLAAIADKMAELAVNPEEQDVFISHGDCEEDADSLARLVKDKCHVRSVTVGYVGPVIGSHTGPGVISLFFLGKER